MPPYLGGAAPDLNAAFSRVKEARERLGRALELKNRATSLFPNDVETAAMVWSQTLEEIGCAQDLTPPLDFPSVMERRCAS